MPDNSNAKDEYARMIELLKHYATLQFAELSVFIAIMSAGIVFLFGSNAPSEPIPLFVMLGMAIIALCLWIIQESNSYQMSHFLRRAAQLELDLGYHGYSKLPGMPRYI